jgi:cytosine/adenosine deaminase-related metal-dependent hydrolase
LATTNRTGAFSLAANGRTSWPCAVRSAGEQDRAHAQLAQLGGGLGDVAGRVRAFAAATVNGGRLLREPKAGILEQGGPADFLLVHGDPLSEPGSLWRVWRTSW